MKYRLLKAKKSVLWATQTLLLVIAVMLPIVQWSANASHQWGGELQQLKEKKLWLERALNILKEHRHVAQALNDRSESSAQAIDSITLSLIEAIKQQARAEQLELTQLTVTESDDLQMESETNESSLHALRVNFAVNTDRAASLLSLFNALRDAAEWRPIEVRGCSVVRLTTLPVSLHATCSVDIYYFPEVHG